MDVELGIIEGYYGRPWSWEERAESIAALAPHGYRFYMYAPKADPFLRRRWREELPEETEQGLLRLSDLCRELGVGFGVGLTPYDLHQGFEEDARQALARKLETLDSLGVSDLGILFDDIHGDLPDLAERQARIVDFIAESTAATRLIVCPSYYTDDPILDRVFGQRPAGYLESLGRLLDPSIEIFWTGEEVCSREFSVGHLEDVAERMRREPFLWDNYPVNDGQRMSQYLHLRGFTGRPAAIAPRISAHAVNPALQPTLSRIPCLTLVESYREGEAYAYGDAFRRAAADVAGQELGEMLREDLLILQDIGLDRLDDKEPSLRERYGGRSEPAAREVIAWLDGEYRITAEIVQTQ